MWIWEVQLYLESYWSSQHRYEELCHGPEQRRFLRILRIVVDIHQAGKGHKTISKEFGLHQFTARKIMHKWRHFNMTVILSWNGWPTKIIPRARCAIHQEVSLNSRVASKELKASIALAIVRVNHMAMPEGYWENRKCNFLTWMKNVALMKDNHCIPP